MSSNLIKRGVTLLKEEVPRIIDSDALLAGKMDTGMGNTRMVPMPEDEDGFARGLRAEVLESADRDTDGQILGGDSFEEPEDLGPSPEELKQQAIAEIEKMKEEAAVLLETERRHTLDEAKKQGYQEGYAEGMREVEAMKHKLSEEKKEIEKQYEAQIDNLEPQFIDVLSGIYEHIFKVDLSGYRDVIVELIADTMRKTEGGRDYIVHVSKEDYPYVNMQKKKIMEGMSTANASVEIIEDITLSQSQALIETGGGIFDCSLGTQLSELSQKLRLLSYEKPAADG
mgnify:CR=1 FL=1